MVALAEVAVRVGLGSGPSSREIRTKAWAELLGVPADHDSIESYESRAHLLPQNEASQVDLDVRRSHWVPASDGPGKRARLNRIIAGVLASGPTNAWHYYQGLHDVAAVLDLVCGDDAPALLEKLVSGHLRDCVTGDLEPVLETLKLLPHLIAVADPELHSAIFPATSAAASSFSDSHLTRRAAGSSARASEECKSEDSKGGDRMHHGQMDDEDEEEEEAEDFVMLGVADLSDMEHISGCHFAVSWLLTWFAHHLNTLEDVTRLFDLFVASDPLMPLYVGAAAVVADRAELLRLARGQSMGRCRREGAGTMESWPIIEGMLHMRMSTLPALAGEGRQGETLARVRVALNVASAGDESNSGDDRVELITTYEEDDDDAHPPGWGVHAVVASAVELHARIPPSSLYSVIGTKPRAGGAFAAHPFGHEHVRSTGRCAVPKSSASTSVDPGASDDGLFPTEGFARTNLPGGDVYEGCVAAGRRHGRGRQTWVSTRERYEGEWRRGVREGAGCQLFGDGSWYAGEWRDGTMDGWGVWTWHAWDGEEASEDAGSSEGAPSYVCARAGYKGMFVKGKRGGLGVMTSADGSVDAGVWRDGALETPMPMTCGSTGTMTATMRAAVLEAERSAARAGAAVTRLRKELSSGVADHFHVDWTLADRWPWEETLYAADATGGGERDALVKGAKQTTDASAGDGDGNGGSFHITGPSNGDDGNTNGLPVDEWKGTAILFAQRLGASIRRGVSKGVREFQASEQGRGLKGFLGKLGGSAPES